MAASLIDAFFVASVDVLALGARLADATDLATPDVLRRRIRTLLQQFEARVREAGATDADVADARYALVAFLDEQLLRSSWSGRQQWMIEPLQFTEFGENTAGEGFFIRLDALSDDRNRAHVLQIYHLCLCLGFQGKYAVRGAESLAAVIEQVAALLAPVLAAGDTPSPHGERRGGGSGRRGRELPLIAFGAICLAAAIVLFAVLRVTIGGRATDASRSFEQDAAKSAAVTTAAR